MTRAPEFSIATTPPRAAARVIFDNYILFVFASLSLAFFTWLQLEQTDGSTTLALHVLENLVAATLQTVIGVRFIKFFNPSFSVSLNVAFKTTIVGFILFSLASTPAILGALGGVIKANYLLLALPAFFVFYFGYFYFAPMLFCQGLYANPGLSFAIVKAHRSAPLRVIIPTIAFSSILGGLVGILSPDGREPFYNGGLAVASSISDVVGFYLAASFGAFFVSKIPDSGAPSSEQLLGAEKEFTNPTGDLLTLKTSLILAAAGMALNFGNFGKAATMEPAARITLISSSIDEHDVILSLKFADEKYKLRGFQPIALTLAGPNRGVISTPPEVVSVADQQTSDSDMRFQLPRTSEPVVLNLKFKTTRSSADLAAIEDLFLWYKNVKLFPVTLHPKEPAQEVK